MSVTPPSRSLPLPTPLTANRATDPTAARGGGDTNNTNNTNNTNRGRAAPTITGSANDEADWVGDGYVGRYVR